MRVKIDHLTKQYGKMFAVNDFSAEFDDGELIALLGPSGCGKSTMLYMLAGIIPVSDGQIYFDDEDVTEMKSEKRGVGLVFQNYALYPHMTVLENICFPLEIQKVPKKERIERAKAMAAQVHIEDLLKRKPGQLSGGQQQRVAIARALVKRPRLLLLDEPLSNLDARLRIEMREEIRRIQQETGVTTVFVTHDQEEAMSISDHILLMKKGVKQQYAKPQELYDEPENEFVADFLGNPPINKFKGIVEKGKIVLDADDEKIAKANREILIPGIESIPDGKKVVLSVRAESILQNEDKPQCRGALMQTYVMGKEQLAIYKIGSTDVRAYIQDNDCCKLKQSLGLTFKKKGVFVFDGESGERLL